MTKVTKTARFLAPSALLLWATVAVGATQTYTLTDLGTFAGNSDAAGYALNNAAAVAGTSSIPTTSVAALFSNGKVTAISSLVANHVAVATAINGSTEIAGYGFTDSSARFDPRAFIFSNGRMTSLVAPQVFPSGTEAFGINDSGEVVGTGYLTSSSFHAFRYSGGKITDLGPAGALQASAIAINNSGQIIGGYYLRSGVAGEFLFTNGKMTTLPVPAGSSSVGAFAINDAGDMAGAIFPSSGAASHAAKLVAGVWSDLGAVSGAVATRATGINLAGQIIGTAFFPQISYHPPIPGQHVPFVLSGGSLVDLNTLIQTDSGFTLTDAVAINDSGRVLCNAWNAHGEGHAVLLTPR